jgi:hypothetical protein
MVSARTSTIFSFASFARRPDVEIICYCHSSLVTIFQEDERQERISNRIEAMSETSSGEHLDCFLADVDSYGERKVTEPSR